MATSSASRARRCSSDRAKAALRYAGWVNRTPAHLVVDDAAEVRSGFSEAEAAEFTFECHRNDNNKVAVSMGADAPRVEHGTERYLLDAEGQTVFQLKISSAGT